MTSASGLVRWSGAASRGIPLVCFPWAGAGASVFRGWPAWLPGRVEVWGARLPGRESRIAVDTITDIQQLAGQFADYVEQELDRNPVIFGLCSGAYLGYELAFHLRDRGRLPPSRLLVAAQEAPSRRATFERQALRDELRMLGLTDDRILEDSEMMELILPAIEADLAMITSLPSGDRRLDIPITAFLGSQDSALSRAGVLAWKRETTGSFELVELEGDHLFSGASKAGFVAAVGAHVGDGSDLIDDVA